MNNGNYLIVENEKAVTELPKYLEASIKDKFPDLLQVWPNSFSSYQLLQVYLREPETPSNLVFTVEKFPNYKYYFKSRDRFEKSYCHLYVMRRIMEDAALHFNGQTYEVSTTVSNIFIPQRYKNYLEFLEKSFPHKKVRKYYLAELKHMAPEILSSELQFKNFT